jgi:hypothetical protein
MNRKLTLTRTGLATVLLALAGAGCGTMKIPSYTEGPSKHAQSREAQGLEVTADPFTDKERADKYFKCNPADRGLAIVHVRAENKSTNVTWLVNEENMHLTGLPACTETNAHDQVIRSDYSGAKALMGATLFLEIVFFPSVIPMAANTSKAFSDAAVTEKNFVDKEWRNQTLSPGEKAEGFIYFNFGKKTDWGSSAAVRIDCLDTGNSQTNTFVFPLAYEAK